MPLRVYSVLSFFFRDPSEVSPFTFLSNFVSLKILVIEVFLTFVSNLVLICLLNVQIQGGGGECICYVGVSRDVPFSWVYFLPENSKGG